MSIFGTEGPLELMVIGMLGVLLFGKRLPEVMRSLGRGMAEFNKGLRGEESAAGGAGPSVTGDDGIEEPIRYPTTRLAPRGVRFELPSRSQPASSPVEPAA
jgi:TatA/E family protein of Tat protein translocase